ncbi:MAG TPA: protein kinase [Gemmatimonadales bacterium]
MPDSFALLKTALADRYAIERELGRGGMATVYLAEDLKLGRRVALKVLRPELSPALGADRFLREITIASRLQHPHILSLHDSGIAGQMLFYAMPYVEGESLRTRLGRQLQLEIAEAIRITMEVADALGYAHGVGVLHRDVKPENILLTADHALVADFGIAKALDSAATERLTETGLALGTPHYMSPEQASGGRTLDARSDLYALGCVLYEMLAGEPPFTGPTAQAILARHAVDPVPNLRTIRPNVPPALQRVVAKALSKVPADRFASAAAFREALERAMQSPEIARRQVKSRRVVAGLAAGAALIGLGLALRARIPPSLAADESIRSLAVAPFENLTGDSTQVYLARGITEQLITELAQVSALRVIDLNNGHERLPTEELARTLKIDALLTGSLQRAGDALHINAKLTSARSGDFLWARGFDGELRQVLNVQRELARAVVDRIRISPTTQERSRISAARQPVTPAAFEAYVRGAYFLSRMTVPGFRKGAEYFQAAIQADPAYAKAYAGLANCYTNLGYYGAEAPADVLPKSRAAALKAVELDSNLAAGYVALARNELYYTWDFAAAEASVRHALELDPRHAEAHWVYGMYLAAMNRPGEAITQVERAQELDPLSLIIQSASSRAYYNARRYQDAVEQARTALAIDSTYSRALYWVGMASEQLSRVPEAIRAFESTVAYAGPSSVYLGAAGHAYAVAGQRPKALDVLARLKNEAKHRYVSPLDIAIVYLGLGDREATFAWLEKAYQAHATALVYLAVDPRFDTVRDDPRFGKLLRRIGLPTNVESRRET